MLQEELWLDSEYCIENNLKLSISKTETKIFQRTQRTDQQLCMSLRGEHTEQV